MIDLKKLYYYPSAPKGGYTNPYSENYKLGMADYYHVLDDKNKPSGMKSLWFLWYSFKADVCIVNWWDIVCVLRFSFLQFLFAELALFVIVIRGKRIVWMLHNIHPHEGDNWMSKKINASLLKQSKAIIVHSHLAEEYARSLHAESVYYRCHPIDMSRVTERIAKTHYPNYDIFIWGTIFPYKGVREFLSSEVVKSSDFSVLVIGICHDRTLADQIAELCNDRVHYENRKIEFSELAQRISCCKYVLFPYIGDCVSSSGALIDTICMNGNAVGPNVGAFRDLSDFGVCHTYNDYNELALLLKDYSEIDFEKRDAFICTNGWKQFCNFVHQIVEK